MTQLLRYFRLILPISCILFFANATSHDPKVLKTIIKECFPTQNVGKNYCVFILADAKDLCQSCLQSYYDFLLEYVKNKPHLFILSYASGSMYNMDNLLNAKNFYNDRKTRKLYPKGYKFKSLEAIIVKDNKIDTVVVLDRNTVRDALPYLASQVKNCIN